MTPFYSDKDMIGRLVELPHAPKRIISLVPSITELLYDLGLGNRVVGITKFCVHPDEWFRNKIRVGGTKTVNYEKINSLDPDLIITNKEENTKEIVDRLSASFPVWTTDINSYVEALKAIELIGILCEKQQKSILLIKKIELEKEKSKKELTYEKVIYLIWKDPYMAVGQKTYINDILLELGYHNSFLKDRYQEISINEMRKLTPDTIFLSNEPYPFKQKHIKELKGLLPDTNFKLVDGELISWYGSRLLQTFSKSIFI